MHQHSSLDSSCSDDSLGEVNHRQQHYSRKTAPKLGSKNRSKHFCLGVGFPILPNLYVSILIDCWQRKRYILEKEFHDARQVLETINDIPGLTSCTPKFDPGSSDKATRMLAYKIPGTEAIPLYIRYRRQNPSLDADALAKLQADFSEYIRLLYTHGVAYNVKPDDIHIIPAVRNDEIKWVIFLGGMLRATLWSEAKRENGQDKWEAKRDRQLAKVDKLFASLQATHKANPL